MDCSSQNKKATKKEKPLLHEFEQQVKDIRQQFLEQVKCLEQRTESQSSLLNELQDFYKRRADIEVDYSKNLDKLNKHLAAKQKADKQKRDGWSNFSLYNHYLQAIEEVKSEAKHRSALADLYVNHVSVKLTNQAEELQRISKKCREISITAQQEILRVLGELHTAMKTYQLCQAASWTAENKVRAVEAQKCKYEESNPKKIGRRRHRFLEKEYERKNDKFKEFQLKALKAKNEYLLCIDAANSALHKYFADDLSDLLDCLDVGFEEWLKYLLFTLNDCRQAVLDSDQRHVQSCRDFARDLDHRIDKRRFLDANHSTFMLPRKFEFKPHFSDMEAPHRVRSQKSFQEDYTQRYCQISQRLTQLKTETEEIWKTLETAEKTLMDIQKLPEMKWSDLFACHSTAKHQIAGPTSVNASYANSSNNFSSTNSSVVNNSVGSTTTNEISRRNSCRETEASQQKRKQDLYEIEDYYLQKFKDYLITGNLVRRLEARQDAIRSALGVHPTHSSASNILCLTGVPNSSSSSVQHTNLGEASSFEHSRSQSVNGGENGTVALCPPSGCAIPSGISTTTTASNSGGFLESSPSPNPNSDSSYAGPAVPAGAVRTRRKKRIGVSAQAHNRKRPKLFGGSIEEYVEMTGQDIPLIIRSCIRMLSLHGLHHQGVFRVSGSQIEINSFRDSFEKGEDPLCDVADSSDVNSVAGVLKLYFRELREPLFPIFMFDQFVECSRIENKDEFARTVRELVLTLPRPVFVVMRYVFAFLNHLSEFSDENMMDPFNLAICFGPTLLPIPESRDQVFFHNHVNELMKNMIIYHEEIFPKVIDNQPPGLLYEKYLLAADNSDDAQIAEPLISSNIDVSASTNANEYPSNDENKQVEDENEEEETYEDDEDDIGNNTDDDEQDDALMNSLADQLVGLRSGNNGDHHSSSAGPSSQNGVSHSTPRSNRCLSPALKNRLPPSDQDPSRRRSVSSGNHRSTLEDTNVTSNANSSAFVTLRDINSLSMHDSLRAIDLPTPANEFEENKIANTDVVWHKRPSIPISYEASIKRMSNGISKPTSPNREATTGRRSPLFDNEMDDMQDLVIGPANEPVSVKYLPAAARHGSPNQDAIYNLYSNLHTSISSPAGAYSNRLAPTVRISPNSDSMMSSVVENTSSPKSRANEYSYQFSRPTSSTADIVDYHHASMLASSSNNGNAPSYTKPVPEAMSLRAYEPVNIDFSNQLSPKNRYSDFAALPTTFNDQVSNVSTWSNPNRSSSQNIFKPIANAAIAQSKFLRKNENYDETSFDARQNVKSADGSELCQHYPPRGHSPTSLKEIQVELKAVLSSLESFASQHKRSSNITVGDQNATMDNKMTDFDAAEIERRFGLKGYLNEKRHRDSSRDRRNVAVSPPDLVQNLPLPASVANSRIQDTSSLISAEPPITATLEESSSSRIAKNVVKPPIPRKPSVTSLSSSPQIGRKTFNHQDASAESDNQGHQQQSNNKN